MRVLGREGKGRERFDFRSTSLEEITIYREGERFDFRITSLDS